MAKQLTIKQIKFCHTLVTTGSRVQAINDAGYRARSRKVAAQLAYKLLQREHVRNELSRLMSALNPDLANGACEALHKIITAPVGSGVRAADKLKAIEILGRMLGWTTK